MRGSSHWRAMLHVPEPGPGVLHLLNEQDVMVNLCNQLLHCFTSRKAGMRNRRSSHPCNRPLHKDIGYSRQNCVIKNRLRREKPFTSGSSFCKSTRARASRSSSFDPPVQREEFGAFGLLLQPTADFVEYRIFLAFDLSRCLIEGFPCFGLLGFQVAHSPLAFEFVRQVGGQPRRLLCFLESTWRGKE
jgi:hypothetical protein